MEYPTTLNPARQAGGSGGAFSDTFFTYEGVGFTNLNGNPAYFDSNNLLTRPAALISGDAFWTDPKVGNFTSGGSSHQLAQFGFLFDDASSFGSDFGFDLAIASVSTDVPASLSFQIQDQNGYTATGMLILGSAPAAVSTQPEISPVILDIGARYAESAGTFNTLNSARVGREARFRLSHDDLMNLIYNQNDISDPGSANYIENYVSAIEFFDIDLMDIATGGGTTQVAIDNFVLNNAELPLPDREPVFVPSFGPIGENTPQYFNYASEVAADLPAETQIADIDLNLLSDEGFTAITATGDLENLGAEAATGGATTVATGAWASASGAAWESTKVGISTGPSGSSRIP